MESCGDTEQVEIVDMIDGIDADASE